jgi:hypothetical protein
MKKYLTLENLGWLLTILTSFMLVKAGVSMLMMTDEMVSNFTFLKLTPYMSLVGVLELAGAITLIIPRTTLYGAILIGSIMSGAVALHLSCMGGAGVLIPIFVGLLGWSSHCLRKHTNS